MLRGIFCLYLSHLSKSYSVTVFFFLWFFSLVKKYVCTASAFVFIFFPFLCFVDVLGFMTSLRTTGFKPVNSHLKPTFGGLPTQFEPSPLFTQAQRGKMRTV